MIAVSRDDVDRLERAVDVVVPRFDLRPLQVGLHGRPWWTAVASVLLCKTRNHVVRRVLPKVLHEWPTAASTVDADERALADALAMCGLQNRRAYVLRRLACAWTTIGWTDIGDLPGVGPYVRDAVGLFCFGCKELECDDQVLRAYVERM